MTFTTVELSMVVLAEITLTGMCRDKTPRILTVRVRKDIASENENLNYESVWVLQSITKPRIHVTSIYRVLQLASLFSLGLSYHTGECYTATAIVGRRILRQYIMPVNPPQPPVIHITITPCHTFTEEGEALASGTRLRRH